MPQKENAKVMIVGFDGATFRVADLIMRHGGMPRLAALIKNGCRATLESTIPWHSGPAWSTCTTGVLPGKHGIFNFFEMTRDFRCLPVNSTRVRADKLWRILNRNGFRTGMVNIPLTYPVEPVDGFMVSGLPRSGLQVYPERLDPLLDQVKKTWLTKLPTVNKDLLESFHSMKLSFDQETARSDVAQTLLREFRPDFFMSVLSLTDEIQHGFWNAFDPRHPAHENCNREWEPKIIPLAYEFADKQLGELMEINGSDETTVIVVSDHGFGPINKIFHPNVLLQEWGMQHAGETSGDDSLTQDPFYTPARVGFDLDRTRVFMSNALVGAFAEIFINVKGRTPHGTVEPGAEYETLRDDISQRFLEWKDPATGTKPVSAVHRGEELFEGPHTECAPDLVLLTPGFKCLPSHEHGEPLTDVIPWHIPTHAQTGTHTREGIFVASGPGIRRDASFDSFHIADITPTVLHLFGIPVPEHMDGRVMTEIFTPEYLEKNPVRIARSDSAAQSDSQTDGDLSPEEQEEIADTLRGLGYFS